MFDLNVSTPMIKICRLQVNRKRYQWDVAHKMVAPREHDKEELFRTLLQQNSNRRRGDAAGISAI